MRSVERLPSLVMAYLQLILKDHFMLQEQSSLAEVLGLIDAAVLEAYDLPPRLEHELLEHFRGSHRPVAQDWQHWYPEDFRAFIPLHRYLSNEYKMATSGWALDVFKPLPESEASAIREYLGLESGELSS